MPYKKHYTTDDVYIINGPGNFGTDPELRITSPSGTEERSLIRFPFTDIPTNATVTEAKFTITTQDSGTSPNIEVRRCLQPWTETGASWTTYDGTNNWGTAGAKGGGTDFDIADLNSIAITTGAADTAYTHTITGTVQNWVDETNDNNGFLLFEPGATGGVDFHSSDGSTKAYHPFIEVWYTVPAIGYAVNATSVSGGVQAFWPKFGTALNADGTRTYSNWYPHRWEIPEMEMSDFDTVYDLRGTSLTGITTTAQDTPNVAATYATGRIMSITGNQEGRRMMNVIVNFMVDVTS